MRTWGWGNGGRVNGGGGGGGGNKDGKKAGAVPLGGGGGGVSERELFHQIFVDFPLDD